MNVNLHRSVVCLTAITLCVLTFFLSEILYALDPKKALTQFMHKVWTTDDGLPQNSILSIVQTRDGYIWLGTQEGLVRFDGVEFTVFDQRNTIGITNNYIAALLEDHEGTLWIGTNGGLTSMKNGEFGTYTTKEGISNNNIRSLWEGKDGSIWVGTRGGGLNKFKDGKFTSYTSKEGLSNEIIRALYEDDEGNLWIGTQGGGLNNLRDGKFNLFTTKEGLPDNTIYTLCHDSAGFLWIGTRNGLSRFKDGKFLTFSLKDTLTNDLVACVYLDKQGFLWVGRNTGLYRYKDGRFEKFTTKEGLSNDLVSSLCEDNEGSLWVGTNGGGLNQFKDGKFLVYTTKEGLSNDLAYTVYEDREKSLWIGTLGGGANRLKDGLWTTYTVSNGLHSNAILSISEASDGAIWLGTTGGLSRIKNGKVRTYTTKDGLSNESVFSIYEDKQGNLWVGTQGGGLNVLKNDKFTSFTTKEGLSSNIISVIHEDMNGVFWIGTLGGGLNRLKDGRFSAFTTKDGLSNNIVLSIYEDSAGSLWIGTQGGGLNRFRDGKFFSITTKEGLFDDLIFFSIEDDKGNMWMTCNKGIFRVKKKQLDDFAEGKISLISSVSYGTSDGMKSSECNGGFPAGCKTWDGKLWFPTTKGVLLIDPNNININELQPPVHIEQVFIDKKLIDPGKDIQVSPGSGELELHYTALSFIAPEKVRFKYKLEDFDKGWIEAGSRRVAYYTNTPPGKYTFKVIASNNDGIWNETGALFAFYLKPHFYQTIWFYALVVIFVFGAGVGAYRFRVRRLEAGQRHLEALIDDRTRDLQEEIEERKWAEEALREARNELERRVQERTAELAKTNVALQADIIKRKEAEDALRKSEAKYRTLFEQSKDAVYLSTPDGQLLDVNPAAVELFGYSSREEFLKVDIAHDLYVNPEDREILKRALTRQGFVKDYEIEIRKRDGQKRSVLVTSTAMRDEEGNIVAYQSFMRDITERKRLEEHLRQIQKIESIGTLAGGIAHDFNNILAIILGYLSLLDKTESDPANLSQSLAAMKKAAERGTGLVKQLLTFARRTDVLLESVNVNDVCQELHKLLQQTFPKTITFLLQLDESIPAIVADYTQLHQAALNLCVNARDAMPRGGTLSISTNAISGTMLQNRYPDAQEDRYLCLAVRDTGEGMDEKTLSRIFEPFFTTKEPGKGTGLGLAVVYGVVNSLRGFVDVESAIGEGTTFYLYFPSPLQRVEAPRPLKEKLEEAPSGNETILVVEDEVMLLDLVKTLLEAKGYKTITAKDGVEAIELYKQHKDEISLVLTDIGLPRLSGVEEALKIKEIGHHAKIILASGYIEPELKSRILQVGTFNFVQKPYEPGEVLRKIREVIDSK